MTEAGRAGQVGADPVSDAPVPILSAREYQVLQRIECGWQNKEIGREMHVSEHTVSSHIRRIFSKLGARDRAHAVALGYQRGVLGNPPQTGQISPSHDPLTPPPNVLVVSAAQRGSYRGHPQRPPRESAQVDAAEVRLFEQTLGRVLRMLREQRHRTLTQTARQAGLSMPVVSRMELHGRSLDIGKLIRMSAALGKEPTDVVQIVQEAVYPLGWPHTLTGELPIPGSEQRK